MAIYYVRTDGSNANAGTGPATNQAWQTVTYALANMPLPDAINTLYIAPGVYRETPTMTITPSVSNTLVIAGDPTGSVFSGVAQGIVRLTNYTTDNAAPTAGATLTSAKGYWTMQNMYVEGYPISGYGVTSGVVNCTDANNITLTNNVIVSGNAATTSPVLKLARTVNSAYTVVVNKCFFSGDRPIIITSPSTGSAFSTDVTITDSILHRGGIVIISPAGTSCTGAGITMTNCLIDQGRGGELFFTLFVAGATSFPCYVTNCTLIGAGGCTGFYATTIGHIIENYNRLTVTTARTNTATGVNTITQAVPDIEYTHSRLFGLASQQPFAPYNNAASIGAGTATGAPAADMFGVTWASTPDIGPITRFNVSSSSVYNPTERNASTITIAPGSISQSIELYLGATGLTASTSGLTARYNRTRTASVSIPLVARTIAQAWTAGGFAEVDATNMPGVYRLDLPDAALAAGADDVTIVVRGASGTNGAVMTVKLSSGGLTEAQTASAVWGASVAGYSGGSTFGGVVTETSSVVNGIEGEVQDVPSNVWEELRANHDTAGSFGEYVNAELVTPVTSAALVRMGPFEVRADGLGASDPLDIQKGAQHGIDIQCVDNNGAGIDITSATVTAKVYNSGATLVDTYSCTATYAADGRATFTIDTTVTNVPGTYTATITRTTGASDTQVFGPLRIYVRDI
jgi:hypothetical protein